MPELQDIKIRGGIMLWQPAIFDVPDAADHFCWNSWHMSGIERKNITRNGNLACSCCKRQKKADNEPRNVVVCNFRRLFCFFVLLFISNANRFFRFIFLFVCRRFYHFDA